MNLNVKIFTERLKIQDDRGQYVGYCPFHPDSGTRSLSVDLDKGVFYCHGSCDEPKGGGPVEFLIKWSTLVEKKPLTRAEARRLLRRTFTVPNAATLLREAVADRVLYFASQMRHGYADALRDVEHAIDRVAARLSPKPTHWTWDGLAALYRERSRLENAYATTTRAAATRTIDDALAALYRDAKREGAWDDVVAKSFRAQARVSARRSRALSSRPVHAPRTPVRSESEPACHARPSRQTTIASPKPLTRPPSPNPSLSPSPTSRPIPSQPKRSPVA